MKDEDIVAFENALKVELSAYEKLLELLKKEYDSAKKGDRNAFMDIFPEKMKLMMLIEEKDSNIKTLKDMWKEKEDKNAERYGRVKNILEKMAETLKVIISMDEKIQEIYKSWEQEVDDVKIKANILKAGKAYKKKD